MNFCRKLEQIASVSQIKNSSSQVKNDFLSSLNGSKSKKAPDMSKTANALYAGRKRTNIIAMTLCYAATIFGLMWLTLILASLLINGIPGLSLAIFFENTPPPNAQGGGLANAIVGVFNEMQKDGSYQKLMAEYGLLANKDPIKINGPTK
jgi:hypothetical protein